MGPRRPGCRRRPVILASPATAGTRSIPGTAYNRKRCSIVVRESWATSCHALDFISFRYRRLFTSSRPEARRPRGGTGVPTPTCRGTCARSVSVICQLSKPAHVLRCDTREVDQGQGQRQPVAAEHRRVPADCNRQRLGRSARKCKCRGCAATATGSRRTRTGRGQQRKEEGEAETDTLYPRCFPGIEATSVCACRP